MIIKDVNLEMVCGITSKVPETALPELAFAGRSNVGKSSLINALMNRKSYAKTSSSPGKTQTINFYLINKGFYLVDLPGYGYTKAPVEVKAQLGKMIERYLKQSEQLRAVFLLIDIRHEPSANDIQMYQWITHQGYDTIIIATKSDKIQRSQLERSLSLIRKTLKTKGDTKILPFSALNKQGRDEIYGVMEQLLEV